MQLVHGPAALGRIAKESVWLDAIFLTMKSSTIQWYADQQYFTWIYVVNYKNMHGDIRYQLPDINY